MNIGQRIKKARINQNLTLQDVASRINISKQALHRVETGLTVKSRYLPDICAELGLKFDRVTPIPHYLKQKKIVNNEDSNEDSNEDMLSQRIKLLETRVAQLESMLY